MGGRGRTAALWAAFIAAHVVVAWLGLALPGRAAGDVVDVYRPWAMSALSGGAVVGITAAWVYPQLALVPMVLALLFGMPLEPALGSAGSYLIGWVLLVTLCDLAGFAVLVGRGRTRRRRTAAWFWCGALLLLGPIALYRIDAITVPLAVIGGLLLAQRPRMGAALLTLGAWIKIWPGALVLAAIAAGRRAARVALTAASVTVAIAVVFVLRGAGVELLGFLGAQTGRGLQVEAVAATPFLWAVGAGAASASIQYSFDILTYEISAPAADAVAALLTPLMLLLVLLIVLLGARQARRGAPWQSVFPPLALALTAALIVSNKVGSPQFCTWLIAPVLLWIVFDRTHARSAAAVVLVLCALTFAVYPLSYDGLLHADLLPVLLITTRNLLLIALLIHAVRAALRAPVTLR